MKWDNWALPYTDESDDRRNTLQNLALYFINLYCHKALLDADFRKNHSPRKRFDDEALDEYDSYLTAHNNAYVAMLEKNNLLYLAEADFHLWQKVASITYAKDQLQIHPVAHPRIMNRHNMLPMSCALLLYGFTDLLNKQVVSWLPNSKNVQRGRNVAVLRYVGDFTLLLSVICQMDEQNIMAQLVIAKDIKPTFISKLASKLFLKRAHTTWASIVKYLGS